MNNKKIYIFIATLRSGGAERVVSILANNLSRYFKEVEIILYRDLETFYKINDNIKITSIEKNTKTRKVLKNMFWLRSYIEKNSIFVSFLSDFNILAILSLLGKKRIIVADRNDPRFDPKNFWLRKLRDFSYYFSKKIVCQTESNKIYFSSILQKKISIIYNPIYLSEKIGSALEEKKENIIISVGRLTKQKNQILLIDSFKKVLEKFPDYNLIIYGQGEERRNLESYINQLNLEEKVLLPGTFKDIHSRIKKSKIFVMTSDYEGMPNALLEAMSLGLPCISTKVSGAVDLIKNYENGVIVERNSDEISNEIIKVLKDDNFSYKLGKNATKIYQELNEKNILNKWIELFKDE